MRSKYSECGNLFTFVMFLLFLLLLLWKKDGNCVNILRYSFLCVKVGIRIVG
jgi:hypothetical protein